MFSKIGHIWSVCGSCDGGFTPNLWNRLQEPTKSIEAITISQYRRKLEPILFFRVLLTKPEFLLVFFKIHGFWPVYGHYNYVCSYYQAWTRPRVQKGRSQGHIIITLYSKSRPSFYFKRFICFTSDLYLHFSKLTLCISIILISYIIPLFCYYIIVLFHYFIVPLFYYAVIVRSQH